MAPTARFVICLILLSMSEHRNTSELLHRIRNQASPPLPSLRSGKPLVPSLPLSSPIPLISLPVLNALNPTNCDMSQTQYLKNHYSTGYLDNQSFAMPPPVPVNIYLAFYFSRHPLSVSTTELTMSLISVPTGAKIACSPTEPRSSLLYAPYSVTPPLIPRMPTMLRSTPMNLATFPWPPKSYPRAHTPMCRI
jgi:hypothetical protein